MENLLESIRAALAVDAAEDARVAGAAACRTILTALEAKSGEPMASVTESPKPLTTAPVSATAIANVVSALGHMQPDQLLDLAITRLRAALPAGGDGPAPVPLKFQIVQLPRAGGRP